MSVRDAFVDFFDITCGSIIMHEHKVAYCVIGLEDIFSG